MKSETRKRLVNFIKRAELIQTYSYMDNKENIVGLEIKKLAKSGKLIFTNRTKKKLMQFCSI